MRSTSILWRRVLLRELTEADRAAFVQYQTDPRYLRLYDFDDEEERPSQLFDLFLKWQREDPRLNFQLGIFEAATGRLVGCGGLRKADDRSAILGIELAPSEWGRFRLAIDATIALLSHGFDVRNLENHLRRYCKRQPPDRETRSLVWSRARQPTRGSGLDAGPRLARGGLVVEPSEMGTGQEAARPVVVEQGPYPAFFTAIHASIFRSSTASGSAPLISIWVWKSRISNFRPSAFSARVRSSLIFN